MSGKIGTISRGTFGWGKINVHSLEANPQANTRAMNNSAKWHLQNCKSDDHKI